MPAVEELRQHDPARTLDVHATAAGEMPELLADACRAGEIGAVVADRALILDDGGTADGARGGHLELALRRRCARSRMGRTTSGMTSPALRSTTWSPMRMSLRRTSSRLWSVARATVEPATLTGVMCATGVSVPVRPT